MYIVTDLIGPDLSFIDIVIFLLEMINNDLIDLFLDKGSNVIEDCFAGFTHCDSRINNYIKSLI